MAETAYIDKYKVYEEACAGCWYHGDEVGSCNLSEPCEKLVRAFASAPAADVAEVAHARWERINSNWRCTRCNRGYRITFGAPMASSFAYCPNCGAMMEDTNE